MVVHRWHKKPCGNLQCAPFGRLVGPTGRRKQLRDDTPKFYLLGLLFMIGESILKMHFIHLNAFKLVKYGGLARYV